jgi:hypothetical protein
MLRLEKQKSKCPILVMHKPLFLSQQNHANCIYEHEANSFLQNKTCMANSNNMQYFWNIKITGVLYENTELHLKT